MRAFIVLRLIGSVCAVRACVHVCVLHSLPSQHVRVVCACMCALTVLRLVGSVCWYVCVYACMYACTHST